MNKRTNIVSTMLIILLLATAVVANEKIAEYRHISMEAVDVHFKSVLQILDGEIPYKSHLSMHVNALADYAEILPDLFAEGSEGGETLDRAWEEMDTDFLKAMNNFKGAMAVLKQHVDNDDSDAIPNAVRDVGNTCRGCHRRYRE